MRYPDTIPRLQFDAEVALVRYLIQPPPWLRRGDDEDRGLRASYRRWSPSGGDLTVPPPVDLPEPSLEMLGPLWELKPHQPDGWTEPDLERGVRHAALVLHLLANGADEPQPGRALSKPVTSLGLACERAGVSDKRFIRLMHTPRSARLEALRRLFRQLRAKGIFLRLVSPDEARRARWRNVRDLRYDDLAALLVFLFTDEPQPAIARWAAAYYGTAAEDTDGEASPEAAAETITQS